MFANGYLLNAWLSFIIDCNKIPFVVVSVHATDRKLSLPMEFVQDGFITLNTSPSSTGYVTIDHQSGYLLMSARFNGVSQDMEIPLETIVSVRSKCGTIGFDMPPVLFGDGIEQPQSVEPQQEPLPKREGFKPSLVVSSHNEDEIPKTAAKRPTLTLVK